MSKKQQAIEIEELNKRIARKEFEIEGYKKEVETLNGQIARLKRDLSEARMRQADLSQSLSISKKGHW